MAGMVDTAPDMFKSPAWRASMVDYSAKKCVEAFERYYNAKKRTLETGRVLNATRAPESEEKIFLDLETYYDGARPAREPVDVLIKYATAKKKRDGAEGADKEAREDLAKRKDEFDEAFRALIAAV